MLELVFMKQSLDKTYAHIKNLHGDSVVVRTRTRGQVGVKVGRNVVMVVYERSKSVIGKQATALL